MYKKTVSLILVAAMLLGMVPGLSQDVSAKETDVLPSGDTPAADVTTSPVQETLPKAEAEVQERTDHLDPAELPSPDPVVEILEDDLPASPDSQLQQTGTVVGTPGSLNSGLPTTPGGVAQPNLTIISPGGDSGEADPDAAVSGTCGGEGNEENVLWSFDAASGQLSITGTGDMYDGDYFLMGYSPAPWYDHRHNILSVTVAEGVTSIAGGAFAHCSNLTDVSLPDSIGDIRSWAFWGCTSLERIVLPDSADLGYGVFGGCTALKQVNIPSATTSIGMYCFYECRSLTELTLHEGIDGIGSNAFTYCTSLEKINLPDAITWIGEYAFMWCKNLKDISFPANLETIYQHAFNSCNSLTGVTVPASVTELDTGAFARCTSLKEIRVEAGNANFCSDAEGVLYNKEKTLLMQVPGARSAAYHVPDQVTEIASYAFAGCEKLSGVTISSSVTVMGDDTFLDCNGLLGVTIPKTVTTLGTATFLRCENLVRAELPYFLTKIPDETFQDCRSLESYCVPDAVKTIGDYAFDGCYNLTQVTLPDGLKEIGENAFSDTGFSGITLPESLRTLGDAAFNDSNLVSIQIPDSIDRIGDRTFSFSSYLESVTLPAYLESIDYQAFYYCKKLRSVTIPKSVSSINYGAFRDCTSLTEIYFYGDAPSMQSDIFTDVTATAYYPQGNSSWTEDVLVDYGGSITWVPMVVEDSGDTSTEDLDYKETARGRVYEFEYEENSPSYELAQILSLYSLLIYNESGQNYKKEWVMGSEKGALGQTLHDAGYRDLHSYYNKSYSEYITAQNGYTAGVDTCPFVVGHRKVTDGETVCDQVILVMRGTYEEEWYGNFDVTGSDYSAVDVHRSFEIAAEKTLEILGYYILALVRADVMDPDNLQIVITGHSRGGAVSNIVAHNLSAIRDGELEHSAYSELDIGSVYAYTFATPNTATITSIQKAGTDNNIFNFCYTDDFVPNLPLEAWGWGKYGKTYWATATILGNNSEIAADMRTYFGEKVHFSPMYTKHIVATMADAASDVKTFYEKQYWYEGPLITMSMYEFVRAGVGGAMQGDLAGTGLLAYPSLAAFNPLLYLMTSMHFKSLSLNLLVGAKLDDILDTEDYALHFKLNGTLNYAHQCGTYYVGIRDGFGSFTYSPLTSSGYAATQSTETAAVNAAACDADQLAALKAFLSIRNVDEEAGIDITNAELLGWDVEDVSTWSGVTWTGGSVTGLDFSYSGVTGQLDFSLFPDLLSVDCSYCCLTEIDLSGCTKLSSLVCSGNMLSALDLTGISQLTTLDCSMNQITELDLSDCAQLQWLNCANNKLTALDLSACTALTYLVCSHNYLDPADSALTAKAAEIQVAENGYAEFQSQNVPEQAVFAENDLACLLAVLNAGENSAILSWDSADPASWTEVSWVRLDGIHYLERVDFTGLELTGTAGFDNCTQLVSLMIAGNAFDELRIANCTALETLWCERNYLDPDQLEAMTEGLALVNVKTLPQRSRIVLSAQDTAALDLLVSAQGLHWEAELYAVNDALVWTQNSKGIYILTEMDLSRTAVSGAVDLSGFTSLLSVCFSGRPVTEVILPASIEKIDDTTFSGCRDLAVITFTGNAPAFTDAAFQGIDAIAVYPAGDATWTASVLGSYGGDVLWAENGAGQLALNKNLLVTIDGPGESVVLTYTPDSTQYLRFSSTGECDPSCRVLKENGDEIASNDDAGSMNFEVTCKLDAGETYSFVIALYEKEATGQFAVRLETYGTIGACGDNLIWFLDEDYVLTISGQGPMPDFGSSESSRPWGEYNRLIKRVVVEEGVTGLGSYAFGDMSKLISLSLPATLTSIGTRALYYTTGLTEISVDSDNPVYASVDGVLFSRDMTRLLHYPINRPGSTYTIPDTVTCIAEDSIMYCRNLENAVIPEGVVSIEREAFWNCNELVSVHLPASLESIGVYAFGACHGLTEFTVAQENTVFTALDGILYSKDMTELIQCPAAKSGSIVLPDGLESVRENAFYSCGDMESLEIPASVSRIAPGAFSYCGSLTQILVAEENTAYASVDGVLFTKDMSSLLLYPAGKSGEYTVPDTVAAIGDNAFNCAHGLTAVTIPDGVCEIGACAFMECSGLTEILLPASVGLIESNAFYFCSNLTKITILNPYCEISSYMVYSGNNPVIAGYTGSTAETFASQNGLSFESLGEFTTDFSGKCGDNLTWTLKDDGILRISGTGDMRPASSYTQHPWYAYRKLIQEVVVEEGITSLSNGAFGCFENMTSVTLPDTLTVIGERAFHSCFALPEVYIPASVEEISPLAFEFAAKLKSINVDPENAYYSSLDGILYSKDQTILQTLPMAWPNTSLTVPEGVTQIQDYAFYCALNLCNIRFLSDAPAFGANSLLYATAVITYPDGNSTWTQDIMTDYGGEIYWYPDSTALSVVLQPELGYHKDYGYVTLTALAAGNHPSYQWQYRTSYEDEWFDCDGEIYSRITVEHTQANDNWQYRCKISTPDGQVIYTDSVTLEMVLPQKLENALYANYSMADLILGDDGIYRTPDGRTVYIAVNNYNDGGIQEWLNGATLYAYVEAYGSEAFDMTHWDDLVALMDEDGYVVLTEQSLQYLITTITGNPAWNETEADAVNYLFYDRDLPPEETKEIASGWSGATTWVLTSDGVLTFSGEGNMKNYGYNGGQPWAAYADQITSVVVEEGVAAVGSGAFMNLTNLESVTLPQSGLTKIGEAAFYGCTSLKAIDIPDTVYTVFDYTFKNCTALEEIRFSKILIKIGQGAFENCAALTYVYIPGNTGIIGAWSFKACTGLTEVDMTWADATEIRAGAFKNCSALTTIHLPGNIQTLGDSCFYGIGAESFTVPETVTTVEAWCFARASLTEIIFEGDAPTIGEGAFNKITLTAYYPADNATWTAENMLNYGGTVTWTAQ